jgi:hypothetical protein
MSHDREARRKNKDDIEHTLKQKWRRYRHLCDEARKLGKVELEEPIRHGWKRKFILNEQTKNRVDANLIQQALDYVNTQYWSRERDWSDIKLKWTNMPTVDGCELQPLTGREYNKLPLRVQKYFTEIELRYTNMFGETSPSKNYWVIAKPSMYFKLKDRKFWITEVPIFDPEIDRETEEIWDWIHGHGLYGKLANKMGWRQNYNDPWDIRKRVLLDNMKKSEMRTYFDEQLTKEYDEKILAKRFEFDD